MRTCMKQKVKKIKFDLEIKWSELWPYKNVVDR